MLVGYTLQGEILGTTDGMQRDIERLNLNASFLMRNRAVVLQRL